MDIAFECAGHSIVGRRSNNEDAYLLQPGLGLFAVADGMGGYEGGEVASGIVVGTLQEFFHRNDVDADGTWPIKGPRGADPLSAMVDVGLRLAHLEVSQRRYGPLAKMGSTVAAAVFRGNRLVIGHVGDSRIYRLRGGDLQRLTMDHSVAEELKAAGTDPGEIGDHFQHLLTRAIGMDGAARPEVRLDLVEPGDAYLLCSDGLWDPLQPAVGTACGAGFGFRSRKTTTSPSRAASRCNTVNDGPQSHFPPGDSTRSATCRNPRQVTQPSNSRRPPAAQTGWTHAINPPRFPGRFYLGL